MQVISNRTSNSVRSCSRPRRRGLSLTSKGKCQSQFNSDQFSESRETSNTLRHDPARTQTPIKYQTKPERIQIENFNIRTQSVITTKALIDMPKITFRYTNQIAKNSAPANPLILSSNPAYQYEISTGQMINGPYLRKIMFSSSIQTKNLSQTKLNPQNYIDSQPNQGRQLIDSRKIDREIFEEKVFSVLPQLKNDFNDKNILQTNSQQVPNVWQTEIIRLELQNECQSINRVKDQSPYRLLISSAKKCQSKQFSPSKKQEVTLQINSLEKIPQVQQFNVNGNEEQTQISLKDEFIPQQDTKLESQIENQQKHYTQNVVETLSPQKIQVGQNQAQETVFSNRQFNIAPIQRQIEMQNKCCQNQQPCKKQTKRQVQKLLGQIQNQPPELHRPSLISGKRNFKRIKEIQKRLEQIIIICTNSI